MPYDRITRRSLLKATAASTVMGGLAGCAASAPKNNAANDGGGGGAGQSQETSGSAQSGASDGSGSSSGSSSSGSPPSFDGWLDNVSNYDGVVDETGASTVTVSVGADGNNGAYAFGPAAVRVSAGTTVVWEWTGKGGSHNVEAEDGSFESEMSGKKGYTFEQTFDSKGAVKYFCMPHQAMGMKGVVVVE